MGSNSSHLKYLESEEKINSEEEPQSSLMFFDINKTNKRSGAWSKCEFGINNRYNPFICPQNHENCFDARCWW
jgi:hypothetical protein